jgi:hypothetical protein
MSETPKLGLPLIAAAQAQKHVTHNEALHALDVLVQAGIKERNRNSPPSTPASGDAYLIGSSPSGAFVSHSGEIAVFDVSVWRFLTPQAGWRVYVEAEDKVLLFDGAAWRTFGDVPDTISNLTGLGIGTAPDGTNKFAAKLNAALFTAIPAAESGNGDMRCVFNKETSTDTASLLFQNNFSGRAELGLTGSDNLTLKVSANGTSWQDVLTIDRANGQATFMAGTQQVQADNITASGTWTKPAFAKRVTAILIGGGGGGAGNSAGSASAGAGGTGGLPGGGGGGGGGSTNGANSGAGGAGGRGEAWIISIG